jgi:hypothetical protein
MRVLGVAVVTGVLAGSGAAAQNAPTLFDVSGGPASRTGPGPTAVAIAPPVGAHTIPGGRSGSNTSFESYVRIETQLAPSAVAGHYTSQMESARWRVASRLTDGTALAVTRLAAPEAGPRTAGLTVSRLSETRVDVALRFFNVRSMTSPASGPGTSSDVTIAQGARTATIAPPPMAVINEAPPGEDRLIREILLWDEVTGSGPYQIQRTMPADFPKDLLPTGAITGTVAVTSDQMTVVATAPALSPAAASKFVQELAAAGWRLDDTSFGGFYSRASLYVTVCRARQTALLRFVPREGSGTYVRASVSTGGCGRSGRVPFVDVAMPLLPNPPGASASTVTGGGGFDSHNWSMRLGSALSLPDLATYYVAEMSKSEWPLAGRVADAELVVTRHRSTTISGEPVHAVLALLKVPGGPTVDAWLRVVRLAPR